MALLASTKARLKHVHDSSARHLLASDEAARRLTTTAVDRAAAQLADLPLTQVSSHAEAKRLVSRQAMRARDQLEHDFAEAMAESRDIARGFAAQQFAIESEPVLDATHALTFTQALPDAEVEALFTQHAARAMAQKLGAVAIGEASQWERRGESLGRLNSRMRRVRDRLEAERKLHALTQAAAVYNEAKRDTWAKLKEQGGLPPLPGLKSTKGGRSSSGAGDNGMRRIWSAILDRKTCPHCWKRDGEMAKIDEPFSENARTPLHGHCRCDELTVFIPEELQRYLPGMGADYDALKDDVRAYMGSRTFDVGEGVRQAKGFVDEALAKRGHSPVALTRRINERAYFPNVVQARAPRLVW